MKQAMEKLANDRDNSVTIDVCPDCKGIWLDKGEFEAIQNSYLQKLDTTASEKEKTSVLQEKRKPWKNYWENITVRPPRMRLNF